MGIYPAPLEKLIASLSKLPGVGQKSATRMALYILRSDKALAETLAQSLMEVKEKIRFCSTCYNLTDDNPCSICRDPARANGKICVVEGPGDQLAIEESGTFRGRYHVLQGVLSPLEGVGPEDLKISELLGRLSKENVIEVILATNPTTEGEATASFLAKLIKESKADVKITRIALGVPMGGDLKYMDKMTLQHALNSRVSIE
ncbi:MAG: recombination protein RecR [Deltaproteobacteria bacterium]|nr:recombination protein RecR [Deltaproteobacteria bacterium]MBW1927934.1 recombination protein RecR [Deltaproteobacteria bacterium]MBW2024825.1 recombination protein RecR [Deltaproteobacteria bacterium]MBW2124723.1 recombination protein RecR [Deltaproteobacteria bacterium]RLB24171.1 MAG: recombination protein RecR [Deltaproteobacteria bacterium]